MSFAYIDSQGKEVQIPSADALRLRIELGAIRDSTDFYDAAQDRWAPAGDHEIYRTLKREIHEASAAGFVAPPPSALEAPPAPPPPADPEEDDAFGELTLADLPDPGVDAVESVTADVSDVGDELGFGDDLTLAAEPSLADDDEFGFGGEGLTLADTTDAETPGITETSVDALSGGDPGDVELSDADTSETASADAELADTDLVEADVSGSDLSGSEFSDAIIPGAGFADSDFGDLELEGPDFGATAPTAAEGGEAGDAPRWDISSDLADTSDPAPVAEDPEFGMAFEGGTADDGYEADPPESAEDATEEPGETGTPDPSAPESGAAPSWIEQEAGADETFAAAGPGDPEDERRDPYERNIRRTSVPPPRREVTPKGTGSGRLVAIVAGVLLVAAAAFFMTRTGGDAGTDAVEEIVLPDLPADLQPQLRALAQRASQRMVEAFDSLPARVALPESPGVQWLSGAYLAQASQFGAIEQYWRDFDALLERMIAGEDALWTEAFEDEVTAANMSADNAAAVRERGIAGWEAASADRSIVYQQLRRVIETSLALHAFLLENEAAIEYTPAAAGRDRDPVLEAVPASEELGDEMWARVGEITNALDALGYLQQVETVPLFGVVREKIVATGIR